MSLVTIHSTPLTAAQKQRIADRVVAALHEEGVLEASLQIRFEVERADVWNSGNFFPAVAEAEEVRVPTTPAPRLTEAPAPESPLGPPRSKAERERFKQRLVMALQQAGSLNSFEAQKILGVEDCEWSSGTLRGFFAELLEEALVTKVGLKRGTRYQWVGMVGIPREASQVLLVKPESED